MKTIQNIFFLLTFFSWNFTEGQSYYQNIHSNQDVYQNGMGVVTEDQDIVFLTNISWYGYDFEKLEWKWFDRIQVCKTDKNGSLIWDKIYSAPHTDLNGHSISKCDGGYVIAGNLFYSANEEVIQYPLLLKINLSGQIQWLFSKYHNPSFKEPQTTQVLDHSGLEYAEENRTGNFIAIGGAGYFDQNWNPQNYVPIIEVNSTGTTVIRKTILEFGISATGVTIKTLKEGEGYVALVRLDRGVNERKSAVVIRLDANLNPLWKKEISDENFTIMPLDLVIGEKDSILLAASIYDAHDRIFLAKLDPNGNMIWNYDYDISGSQTNLWALGLSMNENGKIHLTGQMEYFPLFSAVPEFDVFTITCNQNGGIIQTTLYGKQNRHERIHATATFSNGDHVGVGRIDPRDFYIIKSDRFGRSGCDYNEINMERTELELDFDNIAYVQYIGQMTEAPFIDIVSADFIPNILNCTPFLTEEMKQTPSSGKFEEKAAFTTQSLVFPNPSSGDFKIVLGADFSINEKVQAQIMNLQGQILRSFEISGSHQEMNLENELKGVFILRLQQGDIIDQQKMIIH